MGAAATPTATYACLWQNVTYFIKDFLSLAFNKFIGACDYAHTCDAAHMPRHVCLPHSNQLLCGDSVNATSPRPAPLPCSHSFHCSLFPSSSRAELHSPLVLLLLLLLIVVVVVVIFIVIVDDDWCGHKRQLIMLECHIIMDFLWKLCGVLAQYVLYNVNGGLKRYLALQSALLLGAFNL